MKKKTDVVTKVNPLKYSKELRGSLGLDRARAIAKTCLAGLENPSKLLTPNEVTSNKNFWTTVLGNLK